MSYTLVYRAQCNGWPPGQESGAVRPPATGRIVSSTVPERHFPFANVYSPLLREGTFAYFCCRTKVWRLAGRDPPVLVFTFRNSKTITKPRPGGRAPRRRLTLLLAQKSQQKRACAALGMDVRMISVLLMVYVSGSRPVAGGLTVLLS